MTIYTRTGSWVLIPMTVLTLSGCPIPPDPDLSGDWYIKEKNCLELCAFTIKTDEKTGKRMLNFAGEGLLDKLAAGVLEKRSGNGYALRFSAGGEIGFELKDGNLVAEEGTVFEPASTKSIP